MTTIEKTLNEAYDSLKKHAKLTERPQQKSFSTEVASSILEERILVAEAATGTGKTIAYLAGALAARKYKKIPIVVATGTKALQEQVLNNDIPKLIKAGLISASDIALAKGRRNYVCIRNCLEFSKLLEEADAGDISAPDNLSEYTSDDLEEVIRAYESGTWNGDFDTYKGVLPGKSWVLGADANNCSKSKCEFYESCAYYKKRKELALKSLIITNQNYLLEDLKLTYNIAENSTEDSSVSLLPFSEYTLIVDEGHHLPEKAVDMGKSSANFNKLRTCFLKWNGIHALLEKNSAILKELNKLGYINKPKERLDAIRALTELEELIETDFEIPTSKEYLRFKGGIIPTKLKESLKDVYTKLTPLLPDLAPILVYCKDKQELSQAEKEIMAKTSEVHQDLTEFARCLNRLLVKEDYAKWIAQKEDDLVFELHACPLEGAVVLKPLLWTAKKIKGIIIVSATLRDINGFSRYAAKTGLPEQTKYLALEPIFDYAKSTLIVPDMEFSPKQSERKKYFEELKEILPIYLKKTNGLILFQSWSVLKEFTPLLKDTLGACLKVQGDWPIKMLVDNHKKDIDQGKSSVLAGVATLSEGLDLPGKYCENVIICALPFPSPADPVEEELSERLGAKYFSQKSLPDATTKLVQMTGRLVRTESDSGTIIIFDKRLYSERYGQEMLKRLPGYTKLLKHPPVKRP